MHNGLTLYLRMDEGLVAHWSPSSLRNKGPTAHWVSLISQEADGLTAQYIYIYIYIYIGKHPLRKDEGHTAHSVNLLSQEG